MLTNIVLDLVLVALLVLGIIIGAKRGFIGTIAKPVRIALSIGCSVSWCQGFGAKVVAPIVSAPITKKLSDLLLEKYADISATTSYDLPTIIRLAAGLAGIDLGEIASDGDEYIHSLIEEITSPVVSIVSVAIAFIVLLIAFSIVFSIAFWVLNKLIDHGVVGVANKIVGAVLTFCFAFVIVWCIASVTDFVFNIPALRDLPWVQSFTGGIVYKFFKSISPLELLLSF